MESLTIRQIIEHIVRGQIRIPAFQRGFVWDSEMVAYLMDSIYKGFPIGALLLWRTRETLKFERQLGHEVQIAQHDGPRPLFTRAINCQRIEVRGQSQDVT